jgi:putative FmdB family regulatory protein
MPLYDFACAECHETFEKLVRKELDVATLECPRCASKKIERQLSLPAKPVATAASTSLPSACGVGPPCGAPWCGRKG